MKFSYVYILASRTRVLYIGVTSDLEGRMIEHRYGAFDGFSKRYGANQLMYVETFTDIRQAIAREKQLKGWRRAKKIALITASNPDWRDLAESLPRPEK